MHLQLLFTMELWNKNKSINLKKKNGFFTNMLGEKELA